MCAGNRGEKEEDNQTQAVKWFIFLTFRGMQKSD